MPEDRSGVVVAAAYAPLLSLQLGWSYLRLLRSARRARRRFYQALIGGGINPEVAGPLADDYASALSPRQLMPLLDQRKHM